MTKRTIRMQIGQVQSFSGVFFRPAHFMWNTLRHPFSSHKRSLPPSLQTLHSPSWPSESSALSPSSRNGPGSNMSTTLRSRFDARRPVSDSAAASANPRAAFASAAAAAAAATDAFEGLPGFRFMGRAAAAAKGVGVFCAAAAAAAVALAALAAAEVPHGERTGDVRASVGTEASAPAARFSADVAVDSLR